MIYRLARFEVRPAERRVLDGVDAVPLGARAFDVLVHLIETRDRVVPKAELIERVWAKRVVEEGNLAAQVSALRKHLGADVVTTVPGYGYRLTAPVTAVSTMDPQALADSPNAETRIDQAVPLDAGMAARTNQADGGGQGQGRTEGGFRQRLYFASGTSGARIAYGLSGQGPVVVRAAHWMTHLEHDWCSPIYGPGIQGLSARHTLLRYDGRGCGLSDRNVAMGTLDDEVSDLEAVVDAAGVDRFVLIGRSQGGAIAIRYAARHPDRVRGLVLSGAYARGALKRGAQSWPFDDVVEVTRQLQLGWGQDNLAFRRLVTSFMFPGATAEQVAAFNLLQQRAASPQDSATLYMMMAHYDASGDLASIRCPTLVLHSPRDNVAPFEEGRYLAMHIRGARFEPFDSVNHNPLPGEPAYDHVTGLVREFVDGLDPAGPT